MENRTDSHERIRPPANDPKTLLKDLQKVYGKASVKEDHFGRRQALPGEIERVIKARGEE